MSHQPSYLKAFYLAVAFHVGILLMLFIESNVSHPVMALDTRPQLNESIQKTESEAEPVKAVSVDQREVQETITRIKEERARQKQQEVARKQQLERQIQQAKNERIKEQQRLKQLKEEADKLAIARKEQIEAEKRRLKEIADQKAKEKKQLAELQKQKEKIRAEQLALKKKEEEQKRLAELKQKQAEQEAQAKRFAAERERAAKEAAARQAQIAGEVNKYKALIVNAISRQWILPENVDHQLSSQFRIRLAPDGMVLDVHLLRSSGDPVLDRSAQTAIYKASPLPVPADAEAFNLFRDISLTVRPEQVRG